MAWMAGVGVVAAGFGLHKLVEHVQCEQTIGDEHKRRKEALVGVLTQSGRMDQGGEKRFEKFVRTNSVGKQGEEQFRAIRQNSQDKMNLHQQVHASQEPAPNAGMV